MTSTCMNLCKNNNLSFKENKDNAGKGWLDHSPLIIYIIASSDSLNYINYI